MLREFTPRARSVVGRAHEEARALEHGYIGCEHILLGLVREEKGLAALLFASVEISVDRVREQVVSAVGLGAAVAPTEIVFTQQAKKVLELAVREARSISHYFVGSEHILLGLLRQEDGLATRSLSLLEIDARRLARVAEKRRRVNECLAVADATVLAAHARAHVEMRAAIEARDFERAARLRRSRFITRGSLRAKADRENRVLARISALLRCCRQQRRVVASG